MGNLFTLENLKLTIDAKEIDESGIDTSLDSGATTITLTKSFASIKSIQVTPKPLTPALYYVSVDFDESVANPTDFDVYIYDDVGVQVAIPFSWQVRGVRGV